MSPVLNAKVISKLQEDWGDWGDRLEDVIRVATARNNVAIVSEASLVVRLYQFYVWVACGLGRGRA